MSNPNNHQWVQDATFEPQQVMRGYTTIKKHVCKICGCEREMTIGYKYKHFTYYRSKILFSERPDCVDWYDRDSLNKID